MRGCEDVVEHGGEGFELRMGRVLILEDRFWKSASNSGVWRSSELTHKSCAGE